MEGAHIGPYRVLGDLGQGGMGKVYLAEVAAKVAGLDDGCRVALKVIHPHLLETPGFFKRFLREAEIGKSVQQDNVVRCFDCDATLHEGVQQNFLVMEYVEGQTLRGLLSEMQRVPEELCRHIGREIAKGLVAIHDAGVIHRDLKPENVLITEEYVVKVMDLGVARLQDEVVRLSRTGTFVGSLEYASPEQFRSSGSDVDARSDLHALGVMLYELSTGEHPYRTDDAHTTLRNVLEGDARRAGEVNPQLSPFMEEVVHTLSAKEPDARFPSAAAVLKVLEEGERSEWWLRRAKAIRVQTKRPLRRIRIPRETALYGRDEDLTKLEALFGTVKAGSGQVLLIEGEAGIGKTRLVDEFVGRLQQAGEDVNFLFASYPPGGAATAAGAFSTAYREHFGAEDLEGTLKEYLTSTPILIPAFAAVLRGETTPTGAQALTKDSLQTVFVHATQGLAAERPTIVLIDDLHFAPEDGRALFSSLAMAVPAHRILLVGTRRPGVPESWSANLTRLEHAEQMALARLGPKDLTKLLTDAFRSERLAEELAFRIARKSDGNPFFAFEIIRGLREGQYIARQPDGQWVTTQVIQDIQVPSSVMDLVQARIADMDEDERELLDVASCCGFEFDPLLVGAVLGLPEIPILRRLGHLERPHRLVHSVGREFRFDHYQVQEALYQGLSELLRERYHAAIAGVLEARAGALDEDPAALDGALCVDLCEHYLEGAQGAKALRYLDAAFDFLVKGYLNDQAIALADRALAVPELLEGGRRAEVLLRKNSRLELLGRREAQEAVLAEARELAEGAGLTAILAKVEGATGDLLLQTARYAEAMAHYETHLALVREGGDRPGEAYATSSLGTVYWRQGRYAEATAHYERSIALAREIGDRWCEAQAQGNLGGIDYMQGRHAEAQAHVEQNLSVAQEIGDRLGEATATGNLGLILHVRGRYEEARRYFERSLTIAREVGSRSREDTATGNLALVLSALGRYEEARGLYERSLTIAREIGGRQGEARARGNLGRVLSALGSHEEARLHHDRQLAIAREIGDGRIESFALASLAALAYDEGEVETASHLHTEALALRRRLGAKEVVAASLVALGMIESGRGDSEKALAHLEEALALAGKAGSAEMSLLASVHRAHVEEGYVPAALDALQKHEERVGHQTRLEARFRLWEATRDPAHLRKAKALLDFRVAHASQEHRQPLIENVPLHRDILQAWREAGGERG